MSNTSIKLKKSSVSGKIPLVSDIDYGELAINYADGKLYYKHNDTSIRSFLDSGQILDLIDSDYLKSIINSTYLIANRPINLLEDSNPALANNLNLNGHNITDSGSSGSITMSGNITGGTITATADFISTAAWDAADGGGQLYLNGATGNRIDFNTNGVAGPSYTTRSTGTKLLLYPALSGVQVDYAMGISPATMWSSVPVNDSAFSFKWYGGDIEVASLTGNGKFSATTVTGGTITSTGDIIGTNLISTLSSGDEGGEIKLAKPVTNTSLAGSGVIIDVYQNRLRFFEQGSPNRGAYIDLTTADSNLGTNLLGAAAPGDGTLTLAVSGTGLSGSASFTANQYTGSTFTVTSNATSANTAGAIVARDSSGNFTAGVITANQVVSSNNGNGTNFQLGDDVWIGDINVANTFRVSGQQDATQGYIVFGNSNTTALGRSGSGRLTYGGNNVILAGDSGTVTSSMIANTGVAAGTYGSASLVPVLTVNAQGQIDSIGTVSVAGVSSTDWDSSTGNFIISTADGGSYYTKVTLDPYTTTNLSEGTNKYYTSVRADSDAKHAISGGTGVTYSSTTGIISIGQAVGTGDTPTFNGLSAGSAKITSLATPTAGTDAANKSYVDTIAAASLHYHDPVRVESIGNLNATYNNGTGGVGATLTNAGTQVALVLDGVTVDSDDRVLIYEQTTQTENGIYVVTHPGTASSNWVLTRSSDTNSYAPSSSTSLGKGDAFYIKEGLTGAGELYVMNTDGAITFGTTNITFTQISSAQIYKAGYGIELSGTTFSVDSDRVVLSVNSLKGNITATNLLDAIVTVDGAASGLDADLLDGQHGSYYRINVYNSSGTLLN